MRKLAIITLCLLEILFAKAIVGQIWIQKADFVGAGRHGAVGFAIGNRGYIGLGNDMNLTDFDDFWEWNQVTNTWTQIASYPGIARESAAAFSIGSKGYVVTGWGNGGNVNELWEWNGDTSSIDFNTWKRKADFPGQYRVVAVTFSIGNKGYVCTGSYTNDLWEWDGDTSSVTYNTWTQKANFAGGTRGWAMGFSVGTKGYVGTGTDGAYVKKDFWEWDGDITSTTYNTWTQKTDVPGNPRTNARGFSIGNRGYVGFGLDAITNQRLNDFWEWDPLTNSWSQKPNFASTGRQTPVGFSIGNKGYIGTGYDGTSANDFWEYRSDSTENVEMEFENRAVMNIYPNPANDFLYISGLENLTTAEVYDLSSKLLLTKQLNTKQLDISSLAKGLYFIRLTTEEGSVVGKFVKE